MSSEFVKRLDDVVREELSILGYEYMSIVASIEQARKSEAAVVRFHPPFEDLVIDRPADDVTAGAFAARVRRLLRIAMDAPSRPPSNERD